VSDTRSAGVGRQPGGSKNVLRGVVVPVVQGAASGARPAARPEAQFREQVPARRAGLALGLVAGVPGGEGLVPDDADAAERAGQHRRLVRVRVCPHLVRRPHSYKIEAMMVNAGPDTPGEGARFLPAVNDGASSRNRANRTTGRARAGQRTDEGAGGYGRWS